MTVLWIILGLLALFIIVTMIRALFFVPKKTEVVELEDVAVDIDRYCTNLSDAIKIKTVSNYDRDLVDWAEFDKFHAFLEERYPLIHKTMTKTKIADASLIFKWEGTDPSLDGIAMLSHQDVVPIADGTWDDWTHAPFSGENDGEFIWGRGAMDMKNHLIAVMETVENLIAEGYVPKRTIYICLGHNEEVVAAPDNGAKAMAQYFEEQGVTIKVISGDNPVTVSKIAEQAQIKNASKYVDASTLKTEEDINNAVKEYTVFGRVTPKQKRQFIQALKSQGNTVAMTGDGVNDILALKDADCSIAMASGSEAARNVSQIVLTDSNFSSMPSVVAEGRKVINNVQKVATLFVTKNVFSFFIVCFVIFYNFLFALKGGTNLISFPMNTTQLSLIDMLIIGAPAMILTLMPNNKPIQGRFMYNVLKNALPGALVVLFNAVIIYLCAHQGWINENAVSTMITISTAATCLLVLLRVFLPINFFKVLLFIAILVIVAFLIFNDLSLAAKEQTPIFYFAKLGYPEAILVIALVEAAYPLISVFSLSFTKTVKKFIHENYISWVNRDAEEDDFFVDEEVVVEEE